MISYRRFKSFIPLLLIAVMPVKLYAVQEDFFVVLSMALVFAVILLVLVVSLLLQEGWRRALRPLKKSSALLAAKRHLQLWMARKP